MTRYEDFFSFLDSVGTRFSLDSVLLVSHLDTDGITALSLLKKYYENKDCEIKIIPQLDDDCIDSLASHRMENIILLDTGSLKLSAMAEKLSHKKNVIIIDHHEIENVQSYPYNFCFINPFCFDINGSKEISTAGIVYLILKGIDETFEKYSYLPVIAAFGDYQYQSNFKYLNRVIQQEAMSAKTIITKKELNIFRLNSQPLKFALGYSGDFKIPKFYRKDRVVVKFLEELGINPQLSYSQLDENQKKTLIKAVMRVTPRHLKSRLFAYHILINPDILKDDGYLYEAKELSTFLNGLSRLFNVKLAINFCLDLNSNLTAVKKENQKYKQEISATMKKYYEYKKEEKVFVSEAIVFVNFKDEVNPNLVGILGSMLTKGGIEQEDKIVAIASYQNNYLKISFRCPNKLKYNLNKLAQKLVKDYGGEAGGHKQAAGAVVRKEYEDSICKLIREINKEDIPVVKKRL